LEGEAMARHFAVLPVQAEGQKLSNAVIDTADGGTNLPASPPIPKGSRLVAVVNNGEWQSAVDVTYPAVYQRIVRRFQEGIWKAMDLYLVDEHRADQIEDGRRVTMSGQPVKDPGRG
jgi:hypothetical protein